MLNQKELEQTAVMKVGNCPILLTVPHDGNKTTDTLGNQLKQFPNKGPRDLYITPIVTTIAEMMEDIYGVSPYLALELVHRSFRSQEIKVYFNDLVLSTLDKMAAAYQRDRARFIDVHGFTKQPSFGAYDFIIGTNNQQTIGDSGFDKQFITLMTQKGYRVFLPGKFRIPGERYSATNDNTLTQIAHQAGFIGMQVEICRQLRPANPYVTEVLCHSWAKFLYQTLQAKR